MTYLELQDAVLDRLNLSSTEARARVKVELNQRYREVTSSTNLARTRRGTVDGAVTSGNTAVTLAGVAKVLTVFDPSLFKAPLSECTLDQIREWNAPGTVTGIPTHYAIVAHGASSVGLHLFPVPSANNTLKVDALVGFTPLVADGDIPVFPDDYHDTLVNGVMADEYDKLEKTLSAKYEAKFEKRLSDLRYYLIKSGYLKLINQDRGQWLGSTGRVWPFSNVA